jgi:hypothetical protein
MKQGVCTLKYSNRYEIKDLECTRIGSYIPGGKTGNFQGIECLVDLSQELFWFAVKEERPLVYFTRTPRLDDFELGTIKTEDIVERIIHTKGLVEAVFQWR